MAKAFVTGCAGAELTADERAFLGAERPWGLILFARNVETDRQLRRLVEEFRRAVDDEGAPVLIDQEGGRVQRLRAPLAPNYPSNATLGRLPRNEAERAVWLLSRLHAFDLARFGIDIDCLPVADVPAMGAHAVIGDRAYSGDPAEVERLAHAACEGLLAGGVLPVIKHMPGHGRANADSHKALPVVSASREALEERDFRPFMSLSGMPVGMTAHVVFEALDPTAPATLSPIVIETIIRGTFGFDGLLLSDDISMHALDGTFEERTRRLLDAGCDIALHCNGVFEEMAAVASASPALEGTALARAERALTLRMHRDEASEGELRIEFERLTGANVARPAA